MAWTTPAQLSIPSGMLHGLVDRLSLQENAAFNSFWDASRFPYRMHRLDPDACFQFLLGCFIRLYGVAWMTVLKFFQFLLGCFVINAQNCCLIPLFIFQFLLGCFRRKQHNKRSARPLSIPSGMLQLTEIEFYQFAEDNFQFLLGCFKITLLFTLKRTPSAFQFLLGCFINSSKVA